MNSTTRAIFLGAILAATLIPAFPTSVGAACYHETEDDNFACCEVAASLPIVVGESTFYLDVRRPYDLEVFADRNDVTNATVSFVPHATTGAVFVYEETNGIPGLQRGGWSDLGALSRWDRCYTNIFEPADTVVF